MEIHLVPEQKSTSLYIAASLGRSPGEIVREALALWVTHQAHRQASTLTPPLAAARILELRKSNFWPEDEAIKDLIGPGRA